MNAQATRNELIDWIKGLEDLGLLDSLLGIKKATQHGDWAEGIAADERRSIEKGLEDLRNGSRIGSKEFWAGHDR